MGLKKTIKEKYEEWNDMSVRHESVTIPQASMTALALVAGSFGFSYVAMAGLDHYEATKRQKEREEKVALQAKRVEKILRETSETQKEVRRELKSLACDYTLVDRGIDFQNVNLETRAAHCVNVGYQKVYNYHPDWEPLMDTYQNRLKEKVLQYNNSLPGAY